jgi:biotin transport system substrate-specific component
MTLQFFFVNFAILFQERRYAVLTVAAYILLGLVGLPVFAGGGGIAYLWKPTFGYILGFLFAAIITGYLKRKTPSYRTLLAFSGLNILIVYLFGLLYFYCLSNFYLGNQITLSKLLVVGCLIFIPGDVCSGVLSSYLSLKIRRALRTGSNTNSMNRMDS